MTGSGSLLLSSESDSWDDRRASSWKSIDNTSPTLSGSHANQGSTTPMRRKSSNKLIAQPFIESKSSSTSYFTINPGANVLHTIPSKHGIPGKSGRKPLLDPTSGNFISSTVFDQAHIGHPSRTNGNDENRRPLNKGLVVGGDLGLKGSSGRPAFQSSYSDYNNSTASRSGSLPPGRNDVDLPLRQNEERANAQYSHLAPTAPLHSHHQDLPTRPSFSAQTGSYGKQVGDGSGSTDLSSLTLDFVKMAVAPGNPNPYVTQSKEDLTTHPNGFQHEFSHQIHQRDMTDSWHLDDSGYRTNLGFRGNGVPTGQYRGLSAVTNAPNSYSPEIHDPHRTEHVPFYATSNPSSLGVQPLASQRQILKGDNHQPNGILNGQHNTLDRNLRGSHQLQQDHPGYPSVPNPMNFRAPFGPYGFHPPGALPYYVMAPPMIPRGPAREHDMGQHVRSPLLEEFRNHSKTKTNKRYELKVRRVMPPWS